MDAADRLDRAQNASEVAQQLCALGPFELASFLEAAGVTSGAELLSRLRVPKRDGVESRRSRLEAALSKIDGKLGALAAQKDELEAFGGDEARYEAVLLDEKVKELRAHAGRLRDLQKVLLLPGGGASPHFKATKTSAIDFSAARAVTVALPSAAKPAPLRGSASASAVSWRAPGAEEEAAPRPKTLQAVYDMFCGYWRQTTMTNLAFVKFCRDTKLNDAKFVKAGIDLIWTRCAKKEKKVKFEVFQLMLDEIAATKGTSREVLDDYILRNAKVVVQGTRGSSKFYDDKSNWTGVAKKGGPSTNDPKLSLATMTNTGR